MTKRDRFSRSIHNIDSQDLDLLECLMRIDQHRPLDERANDLLDRLVEGGLVDRENGDLSLTPAGVERQAPSRGLVARNESNPRLDLHWWTEITTVQTNWTVGSEV